AVRANDERGRRGWIDDRIAHGAVCPNYQFGWEQLADYHESLTDELRDELGRALLDPPFSSDDAVGLLRQIRATEARNAARPDGEEVPAHSDAGALQAARYWLGELDTAERAGRPGQWWIALRKDLLVADLAIWRTLAAEADEAVEKLTDSIVAD